MLNYFNFLETKLTRTLHVIKRQTTTTSVIISESPETGIVFRKAMIMAELSTISIKTGPTAITTVYIHA